MELEKLFDFLPAEMEYWGVPGFSYGLWKDGQLLTKGASGYARYDAMVAYRIDRNLTVQLNLYNLGDKVYYNGVRSPHYATMAAGRSAVASLKWTY